MDVSRRQFLASAGLGAFISLCSQKVEAGLFFAKRLFAVPPRDTPPITPNNKFYIVNIDAPGFVTQNLDVNRWALSLTGLIKKPLTLTYREILSRPATEMPVTLQCIENTVDGSAISTAVWKGVPLRTLLQEAGADAEAAVKVVLRAAEGYSDSIPFDRAMTGDVLLAYQMNGVALPREHGYPLRAVVPGIYGIKNVKWITEIEVTNFDYKGYWQQRGWTDAGVMKIMSRIDDPGHYQEIRDKEYWVRGIAFAGAIGVKTVELSVDGGRIWTPAQLEPPASPYTWVFWRYLWRPAAGVYNLVVRAVDQKGRTQSPRFARAFPDGPEGFHTIVVEVRK